MTEGQEKCKRSVSGENLPPNPREYGTYDKPNLERARLKRHFTTMTTKHTAIYLRVSSKQQDHASQMPDLERWAAAHDGEVQWFKDKFTGKTMNRPGMDRLCRPPHGKMERIVVWRLDRLGRTTRGLCQLFDELTERKVDLVSLEDGFSLASPAGRLHARISPRSPNTKPRSVPSGLQLVRRWLAARASGGAAARRAGVGRSRMTKWQQSTRWAAGKKVAHIARVTGLSRPTMYRVLRQSQPTGKS